jgi:LAO/AO transport system kinase
MTVISNTIAALKEGSVKTLARCITMVENDLEGSSDLLKQLKFTNKTPVIGITGPPGAGKSSLVNEIISELIAQNLKVGIIAVDPTSPFNLGSILGDRVRMSEHFNHPNVFIRSIATRGSLGGLSAKIIEITDVMRAANFDYIIIETVGVGQSEVEIVGIADCTILVLVPEGGDEIQQLKSGVMEIADIFVVNKSDRIGASTYLKNLYGLLHSGKKTADYDRIIKTVAIKHEGIKELLLSVTAHLSAHTNQLQGLLFAEKAFKIIQNKRMQNVDKKHLQQRITEEITKPDFNLYQLIADLGY